MPVVAFLNVGSPDVRASRVTAFRKGLGETGYVEGQNVLIEYHWLGGQYEKLKALLDGLVQRRVSVIAIPGSTPVSLAAKAAIADIPIVFGVAENPVTLGLVKSLAQPGGNATGINFFSEEAVAKRFDLMHALLPRAMRFAVLVNPANVRYTEATTKSLSDATRSVGVEAVFFKASTPAEIDEAFAAMARERVDALFIGGEAFFSSRAVQLATLTARDRLPASAANRELVQAGLLMSYGTNLSDMGRQVGGVHPGIDRHDKAVTPGPVTGGPGPRIAGPAPADEVQAPESRIDPHHRDLGIHHPLRIPPVDRAAPQLALSGPKGYGLPAPVSHHPGSDQLFAQDSEILVVRLLCPVALVQSLADLVNIPDEVRRKLQVGSVHRGVKFRQQPDQSSRSGLGRHQVCCCE